MEKLGKRYFDLDTEKCTACCACVLACMDQNDIDTQNHQHPFRNAFEYEPGASNPGRDARRGDAEPTAVAYLSVSCQHCDDAPCVTACPTGCLYKDPDTGFTLYDNAKCIGCHSCAMACPFGAPSFNAEGKMVKCDGCIERQHAGLQPACVRVCPGGALSCKPAAEYDAEQNSHSLRTLAQRIINEQK